MGLASQELRRSANQDILDLRAVQMADEWDWEFLTKRPIVTKPIANQPWAIGPPLRQPGFLPTEKALDQAVSAVQLSMPMGCMQCFPFASQLTLHANRDKELRPRRRQVGWLESGQTLREIPLAEYDQE